MKFILDISNWAQKQVDSFDLNSLVKCSNHMSENYCEIKSLILMAWLDIVIRLSITIKSIKKWIVQQIEYSLDCMH